MFYIYALTDPRNDKFFYVGVTTNPDRRLRRHLTDAKNEGVSRVVLEVEEAGLSVGLEILEEVEDLYMKFSREKYWILRCADEGHTLSNVMTLREDSLPVATSLPRHLAQKLEQMAREAGKSRSEFTRELLVKALK
jgi:hypothetical protein